MRNIVRISRKTRSRRGRWVRRVRSRRAFAYVLAMILITLFATMAMAFVSESVTNARKSANIAEAQDARLQAESGLTYLYYLIHKNGTMAKQGTAVLDELALKLPTWMGDSLHGQAISHVAGGPIYIPAISAGGSGTFSVVISLDDVKTLRVSVPGANGATKRGVNVACTIAPGVAAACHFGIASKGPINLAGNASVRGVNAAQALDGSILSTYMTAVPISMTGNAGISGDASLSNPAGTVPLHATPGLNGNANIGGEGIDSPQLATHIHIGGGDVEFPTADPSVFKPFATNIVDSHTNTVGKTFTNILIKAGTNPTFSGNTTLKGIVYVETPNVVTFAGNLALTGVVATDDAGGADLTHNAIKFAGNTSISGVDALPDTPAFHAIKQLPGTFLVAPGFSASFAGNFGTINGAMAANQFTWLGNAGGTIKGCIINWGDTPFTVGGNSNLVFDRSGDPASYPGLGSKTKLTATPGSYEEF